MKFIHLSDLHIGKRVSEFSMLQDQIYILDRIVDVIDDERPDAVLIAGDVYDKTVPPAEAVQVFDDFLYRLAARGLQVFVISGNHDSPERIAFGARLMDKSGIHMSPVYDGTLRPVTLRDAWGPVHIFMLPFVKPLHVRRYFPDEDIESYTDAVRTALAQAELPSEERCVLVTHQFVTGALRCESEEISVGGTDNVDAGVFSAFDYVALGHIHGPQDIGSPRLRYCGTPLKYSFSEMGHRKSVTVVELEEKGRLTVRTVPLTPLRDLREVRGTFAQLTDKAFYTAQQTDDYLHIVLTDEEDVPNAMGQLRVVYPNMMKLDYDNRRTRAMGQVGTAGEVERRSPLELFDELYEKQNGRPMEEAQKAYLTRLIGEIWEEERL
ncbi:MAG: exonuclease SbcCD subunit D [Butyricicoccaceae bacterium]